MDEKVLVPLLLGTGVPSYTIPLHPNETRARSPVPIRFSWISARSRLWNLHIKNYRKHPKHSQQSEEERDSRPVEACEEPLELTRGRTNRSVMVAKISAMPTRMYGPETTQTEGWSLSHGEAL
jgi:hypothetical protein